MHRTQALKAQKGHTVQCQPHSHPPSPIPQPSPLLKKQSLFPGSRVSFSP